MIAKNCLRKSSDFYPIKLLFNPMWGWSIIIAINPEKEPNNIASYRIIDNYLTSYEKNIKKISILFLRNKNSYKVGKNTNEHFENIKYCLMVF